MPKDNETDFARLLHALDAIVSLDDEGQAAAAMGVEPREVRRIFEAASAKVALAADRPACLRPAGLSPRPAPAADPSLVEMRELAARADDLFEGLPGDVYLKKPKFFDEIKEKIADIAKTCDRRGSATANQVTAVTNMIEAVEKWL